MTRTSTSLLLRAWNISQMKVPEKSIPGDGVVYGITAGLSRRVTLSEISLSVTRRDRPAVMP